MENSEKDISSLLVALLKSTNSVVESYHNAAKNVHNEPLRVFFSKAAEKHEQFVATLKSELNNRGEDATADTTLSSDNDRFWNDFAAIIVERNEAGILKNCAKAERKSIQAYDELIQKNGMPAEFLPVLKKQRDLSQQQLDEVNNLERKYASD